MPGDLPSDYEASVFYDAIQGVPDIFDANSFPYPDAITALEINDTTQSIKRYVVIMLYNSLQPRELAYFPLGFLAGWGSDSFEDISYVGSGATIHKKHVYGKESVTFIRCNALVYLITTGETRNFAQRSDERLTR